MGKYVAQEYRLLIGLIDTACARVVKNHSNHSRVGNEPRAAVNCSENVVSRFWFDSTSLRTFA